MRPIQNIKKTWNLQRKAGNIYYYLHIYKLYEQDKSYYVQVGNKEYVQWCVLDRE